MNKRSYRQRCSLAYGLDVLGERWTWLIVRELLIQACRFGDLQTYPSGIGTNLLSARLRELESQGLIEREAENSRAPYRLTQCGESLEPAVLEVIRWAYRNTAADPSHVHRDHWDILAMKAFFRPERSTRDIVVQFESERLTAWTLASPGGFSHGMGYHDAPDLELDMTIADLQQLVDTGSTPHSTILTEFTDCFDVPATPSVGDNKSSDRDVVAK